MFFLFISFIIPLYLFNIIYRVALLEFYFSGEITRFFQQVSPTSSSDTHHCQHLSSIRLPPFLITSSTISLPSILTSMNHGLSLKNNNKPEILKHKKILLTNVKFGSNYLLFTKMKTHKYSRFRFTGLLINTSEYIRGVILFTNLLIGKEKLKKPFNRLNKYFLSLFVFLHCSSCIYSLKYFFQSKDKLKRWSKS